MARAGEDRLISQVLPFNAELAKRKQVFFAASQAVATLTVGLATTYTGLCISNPVRSLYDLHLISATMMQSVIQATNVEAYAVAVGYHAATDVTHTTPGSIYSGYVANAPATNVSAAKIDTAATLPTAPVYARFMTNTPSISTNAAGIYLPINGEIILGPGAYAVFTAPAQASVAGMWFSWAWAEVLTTPLN
jgi:hypothetical protein